MMFRMLGVALLVAFIYGIVDANAFVMDNVPVERDATTFCRVVEFSNGIEAIQCATVADSQIKEVFK